MPRISTDQPAFPDACMFANCSGRFGPKARFLEFINTRQLHLGRGLKACFTRPGMQANKALTAYASVMSLVTYASKGSQLLLHLVQTKLQPKVIALRIRVQLAAAKLVP